MPTVLRVQLRNGVSSIAHTGRAIPGTASAAAAAAAAGAGAGSCCERAVQQSLQHSSRSITTPTAQQQKYHNPYITAAKVSHSLYHSSRSITFPISQQQKYPHPNITAAEIHMGRVLPMLQTPIIWTIFACLLRVEQ